MAMDAPDLPPRFPCWVKAVYSWGGETKRDLGFIEGDLIECLNAGDGSWWVGRLYRDKRMVGSFPSNFVKVLDESYHPVARVSKNAPVVPKPSIPIPAQSLLSNSTNVSPRKSMSMFRKPFTAYGAADTPASTAPPSPAGSIKKSFSPKPYSSMKTSGVPAPKAVIPSPAPSPSIPAPIPRASSPLPPVYDRPSRAPSPLIQRTPSRVESPEDYYNHPNPTQSQVSSPYPPRQMTRVASPAPYYDRSTTASPSPYHKQMDYANSRPASPQPPRSMSRMASPEPYSTHYDYNQPRASSPAAYEGEGEEEEEEEEDTTSPPPPPPPAHRNVYAQNHALPSNLHHEEYYDDYQGNIDRQPSSALSNRGGGRTPSPFHDAMHEVMNSLDEMSMAGRSPSPAPGQGHDNFGQVYLQSGRCESRGSARYDHEQQEYRDSEDWNQRSLRDAGYENNQQQDPVEGDSNDRYPSLTKREATPKLANYLRRMDSRLRERQDQGGARYGRRDQIASPSLNRYDSGTTIRADETSNLPRADSAYASSTRPSSSDFEGRFEAVSDVQQELRSRKSAYELGRPGLARSFTAKSAVTDFSSASQMTDHSLMSGYSAGGFSATSAGSLARSRWHRDGSIKGRPKSVLGSSRTGTSMSSISYHSSHDSNTDHLPGQQSVHSLPIDSDGMVGGFQRPVVKKRSFLRRVIDSAKTSAATARSTISAESGERSTSPQKMLPNGITAISGGVSNGDVAKSMDLDSSVDWLQMRRDVNRCNSLSRAERNERAEQGEMMDIRVISPINILLDTAEGDESQDGYPVTNPTDFTSCNFTLVDKNVRFISNLPAMINPTSLAQSYICRPYRSDVQRLRAIFIWVSERVHWEEDFEGDVDTVRVVQTKRGCSEEIAALVYGMCTAIGIHAEVVRGHLKEPTETLSRHNLSEIARPNHWWNAVIVDGEWRIMDCSLAGPTNPYRKTYSDAGNQVADTWWFLARPMEICYTHVPEFLEQQHITPVVPQHVLMALPVAGSPYFRNGIQMWDFDTSQSHMEGLEAAHIHFTVPEDVECIAEVEARSITRDLDGEFFENGKIEKMRAMAQAEFLQYPGDLGDGMPFKRYTVKALLPASTNSSTQGVLKIYAGHRGLMHSINNIPHPLALSIPLTHRGVNPEYEFFTRHPTPHALRHELYVVNPLCKRLAVNNTFVFGVRQHPASSTKQTLGGSQTRPASALAIKRPTSAMSMASISISGSGYSAPSVCGSDQSSSTDSNGHQREKPAKLAIQSPSGKILRMTKKLDQGSGKIVEGGLERAGSAWETIIKIGEKGTWRGLVLADRSVRWCVFGEWECV